MIYLVQILIMNHKACAQVARIQKISLGMSKKTEILVKDCRIESIQEEDDEVALMVAHGMFLHPIWKFYQKK